MQESKLRGGAQISEEIRIDARLDIQESIESYLASDSVFGHALVFLVTDYGDSALAQLEKTVAFYRDSLNIQARCGRIDEGLYFAEQFPLGEFMFEWLERRERVSLPEAIKRVIAQLKTLQLAHENGIYHGRITPKSMLLERSFDDFELRMMGLGVTQALERDLQLDIDWFDYTFDLEGMTPQAVDIYGMAIILMGLVSGESGIDSFEATGLLPQILRGGLLQQAMERALALRIDSYNDVLSFSQDLEAALLELDDKQGELFVSDLVGFESAVRSIASIMEEAPQHRDSGDWNTIVDHIEQNEKSNLLRSLTSLTAIRAVDADEEDEITRISAVPDFVLNTRRIRSAHNQIQEIHTEGDSSIIEEEEDNRETQELPGVVRRIGKSDSESSEESSKTEVDLDEKTSQKIADIQNLEAELDVEDDDEAPTRVMQRPNYISISLSSEEPEAEEKVEDKLTRVIRGVQTAEVEEAKNEIPEDVIYDIHDPAAYPNGYIEEKPEPEPVQEQPQETPAPKDDKKEKEKQERRHSRNLERALRKKKLAKSRKIMRRLELALVIAIVILAIVVIYKFKISS